MFCYSRQQWLTFLLSPTEWHFHSGACMNSCYRHCVDGPNSYLFVLGQQAPAILTQPWGIWSLPSEVSAVLRVTNFVRHLMSSLECGVIGALIPAVQPRALAWLRHVGRCYMFSLQWHFSPDESAGSPDHVLHRWLYASSCSGRRVSLTGEKEEWPWCDRFGGIMSSRIVEFTVR